MKKYLLLIILFLPLMVVNAEEKQEVTLVKCVDGDTATFSLNGEDVKFRFLAIDTPETVHPTKGEEEGGKAASEYTCEALTNASKIEILYDEKSSKTDKYGRGLAWIYVDDVLLQEDLVAQGYAEVAYIYGNYSLVPYLCEVQSKAKEAKLGIWSTDREEGYCATKTNSTTTTIASSSDETTTTTTTTTTESDDVIATLEDMIDSTTSIPILIVLCVILLIAKSAKGQKKKSKKK